MKTTTTLLAIAIAIFCSPAAAAIVRLDTREIRPDPPQRDYPLVVTIDTETNQAAIETVTFARGVSTRGNRSTKLRFDFPPTGPFAPPTRTYLGVGVYATFPADTYEASTPMALPEFVPSRNRYEWIVRDALPDRVMARVTGYVYEGSTGYQRRGDPIETFDLGEVEYVRADDPSFYVTSKNLNPRGVWRVGIRGGIYYPAEPFTFTHEFFDGRTLSVSLLNTAYSARGAVWVPEPSALLLAVLGIVGLMAGRRQR